MNAETLLDAIGSIDDQIIAEARTIKPRKPLWMALPAAAIVSALVTGSVLLLLRGNAPVEEPILPPTTPSSSDASPIPTSVPPSDSEPLPSALPTTPSPSAFVQPSELPKLTVNGTMGDFGFEGYMAYDISELQNGNPWTEDAELPTLPVFQNPVVYDDGTPVSGYSTDTLVQKAEETARKLGLSIDSLTVEPERVLAVCGDVTIHADPDGMVRIFVKKEWSQPSEYTSKDYQQTKDEATAATRFFLEAYAPIVEMESPALDVYGDYTYDARLRFEHNAYENSGSLIERLLHYHFNWVNFGLDDGGELYVIDRMTADLSQKLGDYPIISANDAQELLLQKYYISTAPEDCPGEEYIAKRELVYRTGRYDPVFMPYYKFWVELPTYAQDNGLKTFGIYYVPAVESEYLEGMPLWEEQFN